MKLNSEQVAQVFDQTGADPVPEDHQAITELRSVFGDHTFYVAPDGCACGNRWVIRTAAPSGEAMGGGVVWPTRKRRNFSPTTPNRPRLW